MKKLTGQIFEQRVHGKVNVVPSDGNSGGPLQAKTAYPSHSEQIIVPDEDYYGLVSVTVKPTPRLPACVASFYEGMTENVENVINIAADVLITGKIFVQSHALYGGVRLPLLPEDVLAQYPYCWIWQDPNTAEYKAFFSTAVWYFSSRVSGGDVMYRTVSETSPVYVYSDVTDTWEFLQNHSSSQKLGVYRDGYITWTNFDIPEGSASATSYFKTATTPGLTV